DYEYYSNRLIKKITVNGDVTNTVSYDLYGRQNQLWDKNSGPTQYIYDAYGRLSAQTDNNNITYNLHYDVLDRCTLKTGPSSEVYLSKIKNGTLIIWKADEATPLGLYSKFTLGNNIQTQITYDNFGLPQHYFASGKQDLQLDFDIASGNLNQRYDALKNLTEY